MVLGSLASQLNASFWAVPGVAIFVPPSELTDERSSNNSALTGSLVGITEPVGVGAGEGSVGDSELIVGVGGEVAGADTEGGLTGAFVRSKGDGSPVTREPLGADVGESVPGIGGGGGESLFRWVTPRPIDRGATTKNRTNTP